MQNRFKSRILWLSIFTLVVFICKTYLGIELQEADMLFELTMIVFTGLGIINNPEKRDKI